MAKNAAAPYIRPNVPAGSHPIETTRYLLPTPSIDDFYNAVLQWIENRAPGGIIYGKPRLGKTRAIKYLTRLLTEKFGSNLLTMVLLCRDYRVPSESTFFEDLLRTSGHALYRSGRAAAKRDRLIEYLCEKVEISSQNRLVLFIDEAQKLLEQHYKWLIDLHNELDARDTALIVLLVGQDELIHQCSAFQQANKTQIIGRFMVHRLQFHGLRSASQIKKCLKAYDSDSEHPEDSGWSFTRYFFPAAFDAGFRLGSYADSLWEAFRLTKDEGGLPGNREIPMQYFCRTVEFVLRKYGTHEEVTKGISTAMWKDAIISSGYIDAERYR
ncbi:MAG TPA: ATP-binding protein [Pyrinomonadaceae bacterium]